LASPADPAEAAGLAFPDGHRWIPAVAVFIDVFFVVSALIAYRAEDRDRRA